VIEGFQAIGVDIGGTGIKAALVDVVHGQLLTQRVRAKTPIPAKPEPMIEAIRTLVGQIVEEGKVDPTVPVGFGIPAVTVGGVTMTAANIDPSWIGFAAEAALAAALGRTVFVVNDADAAGLAEMRFGAGHGRAGTVLLLTLGTGIGSALFVDGRLVPNTELGHIEMRGKDAEQRAAASVRTRRKLSWDRWAAELNDYLNRIDRLLWPDLIILGGGVSKEAPRFVPKLTVRPPIVPAQLLNNAGIVGAAMIAIQRQGPAIGLPGA
jgi:polyphosphate glucokinase